MLTHRSELARDISDVAVAGSFACVPCEGARVLVKKSPIVPRRAGWGLTTLLMLLMDGASGLSMSPILHGKRTRVSASREMG